MGEDELVDTREAIRAEFMCMYERERLDRAVDAIVASL